MSALEFRLLNDFQRGFPLCPEPYARIAAQLGTSPEKVIATLARLRHAGAVSRIGAVFRPGAIGASTLAAMAVPPARLAAVARRISAFPEVNHNYEREHAFNLWFVATASDAASLQRVLREISGATGIEVLPLPLVEEYHIDLGFDLAGGGKIAAEPMRFPAPAALDLRQRRLVAALRAGLKPVARPYAELAARAQSREAQAIAQLHRWLDGGVIRRFGVVVRHLELGYSANAMAVWDVPDAEAGAIGARLAARPGVTLCYRRARRAARWPYNLYCMIHGRERDEVERVLAQLNRECGLAERPNAVLFSVRRFKQTGARYAGTQGVAHGFA